MFFEVLVRATLEEPDSAHVRPAVGRAGRIEPFRCLQCAWVKHSGRVIGTDRPRALCHGLERHEESLNDDAAGDDSDRSAELGAFHTIYVP
jgi:hypothetical protein